MTTSRRRVLAGAANLSPSDAHILTHALLNPIIPVAIAGETDEGTEVSASLHLTPDQAEGFALNLLEQPHAGRGMEK